MSRFLPLVFLLFLLVLPPGALAELAAFQKSTLIIDTDRGPQRFNIEIAETPQQQEQGLMFRRSLPANAGMLFDFGSTEPAAFWMKNTLIPLDMLFIAADGKIADIHERAVPLSEATIYSKVPVRAVLELNGGTVSRLGIHLGDVVHFPIFGN
jgi:uncharacterized membrane protein (UPF0127 family)